MSSKFKETILYSYMLNVENFAECFTDHLLCLTLRCNVFVSGICFDLWQGSLIQLSVPCYWYFLYLHHVCRYHISRQACAEPIPYLGYTHFTFTCVVRIYCLLPCVVLSCNYCTVLDCFDFSYPVVDLS